MAVEGGVPAPSGMEAFVVKRRAARRMLELWPVARTTADAAAAAAAEEVAEEEEEEGAEGVWDARCVEAGVASFWLEPPLALRGSIREASSVHATYPVLP